MTDASQRSTAGTTSSSTGQSTQPTAQPAARPRTGTTEAPERRVEPVRRPSEERVHRARHARQILSGAELEPPTRLSSAWVSPSAGLTESQRTYLIALGVLLLVGLVLLATVGLDVASIVFFILALGLIGGWLAF